MNQHLFVKIRSAGSHQLIVAYMDVGEGREQERKFCNLANRQAITCDWRLDLPRSGVPVLTSQLNDSELIRDSR